MSLRKIEKLRVILERAVYGNRTTLDETRALQAVSRMAELVKETPAGDEIWLLGDDDGLSVSDIIVGAYWYANDSHEGQWSQAYSTLSALTEIYTPGMNEARVEEGTPEYEVYCSLEYLSNAD